jgi:hypothetical protein
MHSTVITAVTNISASRLGFHLPKTLRESLNPLEHENS